MSRRSTPERIDAAREAATRQRLIGTGMTPEAAEAWISAWQRRPRRTGWNVVAPIGLRVGSGSRRAG